MTFDGIENNLRKVKNQNAIYLTEHIFFDMMRKNRENENIFDTFAELMKSFNIGKVSATAEYLKREGYNCCDTDLSEKYFSYIKSNTNDFITGIKKGLT